MINIKPAINSVFRSNALDFEDNTFVGLHHDSLRPDSKWHCVPVLYENNLYLLNKARFSKTSDGMPAYNTYNLNNEQRQYRIEGYNDMEHQAPEMQLLYDLYCGNEVRLLTYSLPIVCRNGSWFAEDLAGLMPICPVFFYYEGWYMAYSYSDYDNCKVWGCTLDYRATRNTLATLEGVL